jgi:hypothetical protein
VPASLIQWFNVRDESLRLEVLKVFKTLRETLDVLLEVRSAVSDFPGHYPTHPLFTVSLPAPVPVPPVKKVPSVSSIDSSYEVVALDNNDD